MSNAALKQRVQTALGDDFLRAAVKFTTDRLRSRKLDASEALGDWEEWRERGRRIRAHTVENLDYYLDQFTRNLEARGARVHFAADSREAAEIALKIAQSKNAKLVAKSKSMVSEEVHINHVFADHGIDCLETDLGEWIVQLAEETPSHIIIPAIHKDRNQIRTLFEAENGETLSPETKVLAGYARRRLREKFRQADIGMTGCNFAIADTGSIVLFSNEGNGRMVTTLPRTHIVMMGMERILPSLADLEVMVNLLPRSATGQKITVYVSLLSGPRRVEEMDGPDEMHVIITDNGRSKILGDPEFREVLNCIRCGACLNACPVYRQIGGHAYGWVYSGPIGAVITPLLADDPKQWGDLPYASSLCGACYEACPVKIPLHDMLVHLRRRHVEAGRAPLAERLAMKGFAAATQSPGAFRMAGAAGRWVQLNVLGQAIQENTVLKNAGPVHGWTKHRALPPAPKASFRDLWKRKQAGNGEEAPPPSSERDGYETGEERAGDS